MEEINEIMITFVEKILIMILGEEESMVEHY